MLKTVSAVKVRQNLTDLNTFQNIRIVAPATFLTIFGHYDDNPN
jgi:hypothetical protein